jgi:hypothetical protein
MPDPFWLVTGMSFVGISPEFHFAKLSVTVSVGQSQLFGLLKFLFVWLLICLFGCCEKLIWVGVGYFWWEVIIKK